MKLPYHLSSSQSHARLYQLADGRFQVVEEGALAPLMIGPGYVLVEESFAKYLNSLYIVGVEIIDAIVYEPWQKQEIFTHRQLLIEEHFSSDMIRFDVDNSPDTKRIDFDGEKFLLMDNQYVFVTVTLMERLVASPFKYLHFSEGLSEFAGVET